MAHCLESLIQQSLLIIGKPELVLSSQQKEAIKSAVDGKDLFVGLPTGHGKSVIFELVPHLCDALRQDSVPSAVLVVSPLIALMESQVADLCKRGQEAVRLVSSPKKGFEETARYVFASPEALEEPQWKTFLLDSRFNDRLRAIFIDEAHCIDSWGGGKVPFREEYGKLATLRSLVPRSVPFVALTATASEDTRKRICQSLEMIDPTVIALSPNRMNLRYSVYNVSADIEERFLWLVEELRSEQVKMAKTLVFCKSIASCSRLYVFFDFSLQKAGYVDGVTKLENALFGMYHAKITDQEKQTLLTSFRECKGACRVLFCTIAFGMGIDIPNILRIIHDGPSQSVDAYVQESGRGGRNWEQSHVILYTYSGCTKGHISRDMKDYCHNETVCRRHFLMSRFSGTIQHPEPLYLCCDICQSMCVCACVCSCCFCPKPNPSVSLMLHMYCKMQLYTPLHHSHAYASHAR